MSNSQSTTKRALAPPRAAAVSGIIFSVLTIVGLGMVRYAIPANLEVPGIWLTEPGHREAVRRALQLVPFACIAFLWFMGVLRDRLGEAEDRFFATVFFGSGLLFVASSFAAAAMTTALLESVEAGSISSGAYYFGRSASDALLNLFAMKMAGVFTFSTCIIGLRTEIFPRWLAFMGYASAVTMLVVIANWRWVTLLFPIWMLALSAQIFLAEIRTRGEERPGLRSEVP